MNRKEDIEFYINQLKSKSCYCNKPKKEDHALCYSCFSYLPSELKSDLYLKIGDGFEEAYEEAINFLIEYGEIKD